MINGKHMFMSLVGWVLGFLILDNGGYEAIKNSTNYIENTKTNILTNLNKIYCNNFITKQENIKSIEKIIQTTPKNCLTPIYNIVLFEEKDLIFKRF